MLIHEQREQVIGCCRDLVRAQSLAGREQAAAQVAERWMRQLGYDEVYVDDFGSVIGRIIGTANTGPRLHFDGHLDTVPATALDQWQRPPFDAIVSEGRIWGRGATDMKGPLAAMLCAAAFVSRERLHGEIRVSSSVAEEEFEGQALNAILDRHPADMVIVGESTRLQVGIAQKGRAGIRITTLGSPAHSSTPQLGDNAVYRMVEAIARIRAQPLPHDAVLGSAVMELVELVSSPYPGTSIVPDRCTARWDRRLLLGETGPAVLAVVRDALKDMDRIEVDYLDVQVPCYTGAKLRGADFHAAWQIPVSEPLVQAARESAQAIGESGATCTVAYCTNASGSAGERGTPTIILGPGDPAFFHVVDEYIEIEQLIRGTEIYMGITERLAG